MGLFDLSGGGGGGGGVLGGLSQLLDPLGLLPMAKQALEEVIHPNGQGEKGDSVGTAKEVLGFLGVSNVKDLVTRWDDGGESGIPKDGTNAKQTDAAETELAPASDPKVSGKGYSKPPAAKGGATASEKSKEKSAEKAQSPVTAQYQMNAASSDESRETMKHLQTVSAFFREFDAQYAASFSKDNKFDWNNLVRIIDNPNDFPQPVVEAARYLHAHPELFSQLVMLSGTNDNCVTPKAVHTFLVGMTQTGEARATEPAPTVYEGNGGPTRLGSGAPESSDVQPKAPESTTHVAGNPDGNTVPPAAVLSQTPKSFDEIIELFDGRLDAMDEEMFRLANSEDPLDHAKLASMTRKYQRLVELRGEMHTMVSNIHRSFHEMSMASINNIR